MKKVIKVNLIHSAEEETTTKYRYRKDGKFIVFLEDELNKIIWYAFINDEKKIWCSYYAEHPEFKNENDVINYFNEKIVPLYESNQNIGRKPEPIERHQPHSIEQMLYLHLQIHNR